MKVRLRAVKWRLAPKTRVGLRSKALIVLVVVAGLLWRLWGIDFGLPCRHDPGELRRVAAALRLPRDRVPNACTRPRWHSASDT